VDRAAVNDDTWVINISLDIVALDVRRAIGHKSDAVRLHLQRCKLTTVTGLRRRLGRWSVDHEIAHQVRVVLHSGQHIESVRGCGRSLMYCEWQDRQ